MAELMLDHANLPAVNSAPLPATYEAAKNAIASCEKVDECKEWADKAQALASYARQAKDDELVRTAMRIQARAIRRAGELLQQIEAGQGARDGKREDGTVPPLTRTQAADDAGLSERQRKTALRVANVPQDDFDAAIEVPNPLSVTKLAERGVQPRQSSTDHLQGADPDDFYAATHGFGALHRMAEACDKFEPAQIVRGLRVFEIQKAMADLDKVFSWLEKVDELINVRNAEKAQ